MEAQQFDVPLSAGLNVISSESTVPFAQLADTGFIRNTQREQAGLLRNTCHFEGNGWGVGTEVVNASVQAVPTAINDEYSYSLVRRGSLYSLYLYHGDDTPVQTTLSGPVADSADPQIQAAVHERADGMYLDVTVAGAVASYKLSHSGGTLQTGADQFERLPEHFNYGEDLAFERIHIPEEASSSYKLPVADFGKITNTVRVLENTWTSSERINDMEIDGNAVTLHATGGNVQTQVDINGVAASDTCEKVEAVDFAGNVPLERQADYTFANVSPTYYSSREPQVNAVMGASSDGSMEVKGRVDTFANVLQRRCEIVSGSGGKKLKVTYGVSTSSVVYANFAIKKGQLCLVPNQFPLAPIPCYTSWNDVYHEYTARGPESADGYAFEYRVLVSQYVAVDTSAKDVAGDRLLDTDSKWWYKKRMRIKNGPTYLYSQCFDTKYSMIEPEGTAWQITSSDETQVVLTSGSRHYAISRSTGAPEDGVRYDEEATSIDSPWSCRRWFDIDHNAVPLILAPRDIATVRFADVDSPINSAVFAMSGSAATSDLITVIYDIEKAISDKLLKVSVETASPKTAYGLDDCNCTPATLSNNILKLRHEVCLYDGAFSEEPPPDPAIYPPCALFGQWVSYLNDTTYTNSITFEFNATKKHWVTSVKVSAYGSSATFKTSVGIRDYTEVPAAYLLTELDILCNRQQYLKLVEYSCSAAYGAYNVPLKFQLEQMDAFRYQLAALFPFKLGETAATQLGNKYACPVEWRQDFNEVAVACPITVAGTKNRKAEFKLPTWRTASNARLEGLQFRNGTYSWQLVGLRRYLCSINRNDMLLKFDGKDAVTGILAGSMLSVELKAGAAVCRVNEPQDSDIARFTDDLTGIALQEPAVQLPLKSSGGFALAAEATDIVEKAKHTFHNPINAMYLKQRYTAGDAVLDYGWLDATHLFEYTYDKITVMRKAVAADFANDANKEYVGFDNKGYAVDDWNGNYWVPEASLTLEELQLYTQNYKIMPISGYLGDGYILVAELASDALHLRVYDKTLALRATLHVVVDGVSMEPAFASPSGDTMHITPPSGIYSASTLFAADITCTVLQDTTLVIGFAVGKHLEQFTGIASLDGDWQSYILGYGYVGYTGDVTGGLFPVEVCDQLGFNAVIHPLEELNQKVQQVDSIDVTVREPGVFGTEDKLWYIFDHVDALVSTYHVAAGGAVSFTSIPFSSSYVGRVVDNSDAVAQAGSIEPATLDITDMIGGLSTEARMFISLFSPRLLYVKTGFFEMTYAQAGLIQGANVWHTSNETGTKLRQLTNGDEALDDVREATLQTFSSTPEAEDHDKDDDIPRLGGSIAAKLGNKAVYAEQYRKEARGTYTFDNGFAFDKQSCEVQSVLPPLQNAFYMLAKILMYAITSLDTTPKQVKSSAASNEHQEQNFSDGTKVTTDVETTTRTTRFEVSLDKNRMLEALRSMSQPDTSTINLYADKCLAMFYSTSRDASVWAGPGFYSAELAEQVHAQGLNAMNVNAAQTQMMFDLTSFFASLIHYVDLGLKAGIDAALALTEGTPKGVAVAGAIAAGVLMVARVATTAISFFQEMLVGVLPPVTSQPVTRINVCPAPNLEELHSYGQRTAYVHYPRFDEKGASFKKTALNVDITDKPWQIKSQIAAIMNSKSISAGYDYFTITYKYPTLQAETAPATMPPGTSLITSDSLVQGTLDDPGFNEPSIVLGPDTAFDFQDSNGVELTAVAGQVMWTGYAGVKICDGRASNIVYTREGVFFAARQGAVEVITPDDIYLRGELIAPDVLAFNTNGRNTYWRHDFYCGSSSHGMPLASQVTARPAFSSEYTQQLALSANEPLLKLANTFPAQFMRLPTGQVPKLREDANGPVYTPVVAYANKTLGKSFPGNMAGSHRVNFPILSEKVNTLPAARATIAPAPVLVVDGTVSATTGNRDLSEYKKDIRAMFRLGGRLFAVTANYICEVTYKSGVAVYEDICPCLSCTFIANTNTVALFFNVWQRAFLIFDGNSMTPPTRFDRADSNIDATWYYAANQLALAMRMRKNTLDVELSEYAGVSEKDYLYLSETLLMQEDGTFTRQLPTPPRSIANSKSLYKLYSIEGGLLVQGPAGCCIYQDNYSPYMLEDMRRNIAERSWQRIPKETYHPFRKWLKPFMNRVDTSETACSGWLHDPFILVTSAAGQDEKTYGIFEWTITFYWTSEMEELYGLDKYAVVSLQAVGTTDAGVVRSRPQQVYLTRAMFYHCSSEAAGKYVLKYQSNEGACISQRLHIWSDSYIAVANVSGSFKATGNVSSHNDTYNADVAGMREL